MSDPLTKTRFSNPYQAPAEQQLQQALGVDRIVLGGFKVIATSTIVFGALGTLVGWLLSVIAPAYYRHMFEANDSDIWQIGVGLGLTQGLIAGLVVGCIVVLAAAIYRSRIRSGILRELQAGKNESGQNESK